jgi:predicted Zn-dependent peptidase
MKMKNKIYLLLLSQILVNFSLFAAQSEIFYLNNGMEVVLIENHAAPVIASSIIIRVGSRDETPELAGASHLLEHLLFNGTTHRTQEQIYEEYDLLGIYNNAHTGENFTNYVILAPKEVFEKGLDIQSDMVFNSTLPNEKFEKERGIVIEEIGQSHDRTSYLADIHFAGRFYQGTPYAWQVLGSKQSIENVPREKVMEYYRIHYISNNSTAIITGDFNPREIKPIIQKYLGAFPPKMLPERPRLCLNEVVVGKAGSSNIADIERHYEQTKITHLRVGFSAPSLLDERYYAMELLTQLLEKRLNETLTGAQPPLVQNFSLSYFSDRDWGSVVLEAQLPDNSQIESVMGNLREALNYRANQKIKPEELKNLVTAGRSQDLFNSERPHFYAMMQAPKLAFHNYQFVRNYYDEMMKVNPEAVRSLAEELFRNAIFIPVSVEPYPIADIQSPKKGSEFFRQTLPNGLEIIVAPGSGSGVFSAHFLFKNRSLVETPDKAGIANFLHNLLLKGTAKRSENAWQNELQRLGMNLETADNPYIPMDDYRTTPEYSFIRLEVPQESWREALTLAGEIVLTPSFSEEAIEATRGELIGGLAREGESASAKAKSLFMKKAVGDNVLSKNVNGSMRSIPSITKEDLLNFHHRYFAPDNLILSVVGGDNPAEITAKLREIFGGLKPTGIKPADNPAPLTVPGDYREKMGKKQSYICYGFLIPTLPEEDKNALLIANAVLSDKMQFELRERQGLAYSLGSEVSLQEGWGYFVVNMGTRADNIETAMKGIKEQIESIAQGEFTEKDMRKALNSYIEYQTLRLLTSANRAMYMGISALKGRELDSVQKRLSELKTITPEQVKSSAKKYFKSENTITIIIE